MWSQVVSIFLVRKGDEESVLLAGSGKSMMVVIKKELYGAEHTGPLLWSGE